MACFVRACRRLLAVLAFCCSGFVSAQQTTPTAFVDSWLQAWESQDTDAYLSHYAEDFSSDSFPDIAAWRASRIRSLTRPASIDITLEALELQEETASSVTAILSFAYRAPDYADRTRKQLSLATDADGQWRILQETSLEVTKLPLVAAASQTAAAAPDVERAVEPEPGTEQATAAEESTEAEGTVAESTAAESTPDSSVSIRLAEPRQSAATAPREQWVPPGFEDINQPLTTEVDVYYGGYFLTSVLANFTDAEVSFLDPQALLDNISDLKNPESFLQRLQEPFAANAGLVCHSEFQVDCGTLETDTVEVIFDRAMLRLSLFIGPDLLLTSLDDQVQFLPPSEAGLSFMNQSSLFFSARELGGEDYNLFNNTMFAWGENRLSMRSNMASDQGFDVDTMAFFREYRGKDYRVGLVREDANGFSFMYNERFAGVAYASSLLTRADLEQSLGTQLEFFFSTRSRVEIYREGRLISTAYYGVGNHFLDTSTLPGGSYSIEIRIIDAAGAERREERFFSKTGSIPPEDQSLYFLHIGQLENELDVNRLSRTGENELMMRGGYSRRLAQSLGGSIGVSRVADTSFMELGLFQQGSSYELQANTAWEDTGAIGADLRLRYRHERFSLTLNGRQVSNGIEESQIGQDYRQYNAILEVPVAYGYYSAFHRYVTRPGTPDSRNVGLRYRSQPRQLGGGFLSSGIEVSRNDDEVLALWSFSYQLQNGNRTSVYTPTLSYASEETFRDNGVYGSYESNWYRGDPAANEYNYSVRADYDVQSSVEGRVEADTHVGSADVTARYNETTSGTEFSGRLSTSFASSGSSSAIGGKRRSESAFLVRVEGDMQQDARFEILVNGSVRGQIEPGETLLVSVSPYQTYDVELRSIGTTLVDLDNRSYRETMYPGNVVNLSWKTRVINIAIGRLVGVDGEPLANAVIHNVVGIAIADDQGWFQAEVDQELRELEVQKGTQRCRASFDNPGGNSTVLSLGTLTCR